MKLKQLLRELEALPYIERMRRMVELGRQAAKDAEVGEVIAKLAQGNVYERVLAVQASHGSRDAALVARALNDPARDVRGKAVSIAAYICSDEELATALETIPHDLRFILLNRLTKLHRHAPLMPILNNGRRKPAANYQSCCPSPRVRLLLGTWSRSRRGLSYINGSVSQSIIPG
ncbi:hypothetical protein [Ktedonospora formicarum]|uniref:HEAT repeat domain-containing protein n=1 Tax=Ktedonospora formicarum TaxID=2778364 RepID=A0A8J3MT72_9CHLR|nr:hypothetical protein [Ktedonospora formicarum]GHO47907.1 hypothetical protein KSX_60700 [Ktedonospora formicarum]